MSDPAVHKVLVAETNDKELDSKSGGASGQEKLFVTTGYVTEKVFEAEYLDEPRKSQIARSQRRNSIFPKINFPHEISIGILWIRSSLIPLTAALTLLIKLELLWVPIKSTLREKLK